MASVTLIIPVYNGERYLAELLDSVQNQSLHDWDCICVNDGSTDSSREILAQRAASDPRIRVVDQQNGGCGTARNAALKLVKTPYVMFADQDDLLHQQAFATAIDAISRAECDCLCFGFERFADKPVFKPVEAPPEFTPSTRNGTQLITGRRNSWTIFVWRHIFRTSSVRGIPFPPISGGEDQAWMAELSWNNLKWASIEPVLYFNREDPHSRSRGISRRYIDNVLASYDWIDKRSKSYNIDRKWVHRFIRHMRFMFMLSVVYRSPQLGIRFLMPCARTNHQSA